MAPVRESAPLLRNAKRTRCIPDDKLQNGARSPMGEKWAPERVPRKRSQTKSPTRNLSSASLGVVLCSRFVSHNLGRKVDATSIRRHRFVGIDSSRSIRRGRFVEIDSSRSIRRDRFVEIDSSRSIRRDRFVEVDSSRSIRRDRFAEIDSSTSNRACIESAAWCSIVCCVGGGFLFSRIAVFGGKREPAGGNRTLTVQYSSRN
jgi:hypothetical protein